MNANCTGVVVCTENIDEIPNGVSIESASYIENKIDAKEETLLQNVKHEENEEINHTPKLFSEDQNQKDDEEKELNNESVAENLFDQETNDEEDFEIPAFLRRQKF